MVNIIVMTSDEAFSRMSSKSTAVHCELNHTVLLNLVEPSYRNTVYMQKCQNLKKVGAVDL